MEVLKNAKIKTELEITEATLFSAEEAKALPQHLRVYPCWWWLRSPGCYQDVAAIVETCGSFNYIGCLVVNDFVCVRPALKLKSSNLHIGDHFTFGGVEFEVVSDRLAFCTSDIGCCAFRSEWTAQDANLYEASDAKQFVDEWFNNALKLS